MKKARATAHQPKRGTAVALSYDEIAEILKIIDGSSCDELIVDTGDVKLVVRRNSAGAAQLIADDVADAAARGMPAPAAATPLGTGVNAPQNAPSGTIIAKPALKVAAQGPNQVEVVAPMVGTFYRAPTPDAPPFVEIDSVVRTGQRLCLIEVMKLFTTIASELDGRIVQIGAENGELVEYGQTLFVIEPS
jgi:acetyl-CoA carboxylase biotin carboxyl carrier protein